LGPPWLGRCTAKIAPFDFSWEAAAQACLTSGFQSIADVAGRLQTMEDDLPA
jgi:hypothetical protein